ncbi:hypothetical protein HYT32_01125 [Candidatus Roizmanbacteria bacterium]|nr:hypothetical protein [Candidatus Roizmanbacteria bacterium]
MSLEHWRKIQRERGNILAAETASHLLSLYGDVPFPLTEGSYDLQEFRPFTDQEKEALKNDGAVIYELSEETIEDQLRAGKPISLTKDIGDRVLKLPSMSGEVAIYPSPIKFYIPDSRNKTLQNQEELAKRDSRQLRRRLGHDSLTVIIPEQASTLTQIAFKHYDETGVWLFHESIYYTNIRGVYGRTKNPVNSTGSKTADVGHLDTEEGFRVRSLIRNYGSRNTLVVRVIVAKK